LIICLAEKRLLLTVPNKGKKPDIKPLPASSDLLNRLQDFMPKMKEANEALKVMEQNDTESDHGQVRYLNQEIPHYFILFRRHRTKFCFRLTPSNISLQWRGTALH